RFGRHGGFGSRVLRRTVKAVMRGVVTAWRAVRRERSGWSRERASPWWGLLIVSARVVLVVQTGFCRAGRFVGWGLCLQGGQRPAPAGEFAGDGDVGDGRFLLVLVEHHPAVMQPLVAQVAA